MGWHILAEWGETSSALVKYLSNRAFHSREWRRETAIPGGGGREREDRRRREREMAGRDTSRSAAHLTLILIREISREEAARTTRPERAKEVQSRFYCPTSWKAALSTFLCPAEIHDAMKCLLKISTSAPSPSSSPLSAPSLPIGSFVSSIIEINSRASPPVISLLIKTN